MNLQALFAPSAVAVVGASQREDSIGLRVIRNLQRVAGLNAAQANRDRASRRTKIHGIFDQLVEQLHHEIGRAAREARVFGHFHGKLRPGKAVAVSGYGGQQQCAQIEIDPLRLFDAFFNARRRA